MHPAACISGVQKGASLHAAAHSACGAALQQLRPQATFGRVPAGICLLATKGSSQSWSGATMRKVVADRLCETNSHEMTHLHESKGNVHKNSQHQANLEKTQMHIYSFFWMMTAFSSPASSSVLVSSPITADGNPVMSWYAYCAQPHRRTTLQCQASGVRQSCCTTTPPALQPHRHLWP